LKSTFTQAGYATQADANYFALKLLEQSPDLAASLARRFPILIIDEAQDSSSIQMRILDHLIRAGVKEVMLVGDPYQAIYEWRQAEPRLFENKFNDWQENSVRLSENWRSTQSICDVASRLATAAEFTTARNPAVAPYDHAPLLYGYSNDTELPGLVQIFRDHCAGRGINDTGVSVLTRSREFINAIVPGTEPISELIPWRDDDTMTRHVAYAKFLFDRGDFRGALRRLEVASYTHLTGKLRHRREDVMEYARSRGLANWRGPLFRLLSELPEAIGTIAAWLPTANHAVANNSVFKDCNFQIKRDKRPHIYSAVQFEEIFALPRTETESEVATMGTVHSVKGRSLDAVFVALKSRGAAGSNYTNLLGSDLLQSEELRIVYVAVTRAKRALALAVPQASLPQWQGFLWPPTNS
jgi:DNA helicase II / ATP-dependent DNA helicase PcrA